MNNLLNGMFKIVTLDTTTITGAEAVAGGLGLAGVAGIGSGMFARRRCEDGKPPIAGVLF
jgi:hypothetical protein